MLNGDVAFLYDPDTTLPLCCFCPPPTQAIISAFRDNSILDPTLLRRWEQRIVSIQLQGLSLLTCGHCGYMVVDGDAETAARQPDEQASSSSSRISFRRRITQTLTTYILPDKPPTRFACPQCTWYTCQGCSSSFARLPHECRSDDLRLQMEKALVSFSSLFPCEILTAPGRTSALYIRVLNVPALSLKKEAVTIAGVCAELSTAIYVMQSCRRIYGSNTSVATSLKTVKALATNARAVHSMASAMTKPSERQLRER